MIVKFIFWLSLSSLLLPSYSWAQALRISQIDTRNLLINQQIKLYLSVTNKDGKPIKGLRADQFKLTEAGENTVSKVIPEIKRFQTGVNYEEGVTFLLMVDNSDSMYRTLDGKQTTDDSKRRISLAKKALDNFLLSMKNPKDRVGLVSYNKLYHAFSLPVRDRDRIRGELDQIDKNIGDPDYTEIYGSINLAVNDLRTYKGRKTILILSDGENRPSFPHSGKPHPVFGKQVISYQTPLESLQFEGISLFVINFGKKGERRDLNLNKVALHSGGATFDADSAKKLNSIYLTITDQILNEYVLTYRATMDPAENKIVNIELKQNRKTLKASRLYFTGTVFGSPAKKLGNWALASFALSFGILFLLMKIKFEKKTTSPMLEVIDAGAGAVKTKIVQLDQARTVIGSAPDAALTIVGLPSVEEQHATIIFDESKDQYRLSGSKSLKVNNRDVSTKILEPGDLINVDGVTMIFDR